MSLFFFFVKVVQTGLIEGKGELESPVGHKKHLAAIAEALPTTPKHKMHSCEH